MFRSFITYPPIIIYSILVIMPEDKKKPKSNIFIIL
jgi:hypothetical protein